MRHLNRLLISLLPFATGCATPPTSTPTVTLLNNSGQGIATLDVAVSGTKLHASQIASGSSKTFSFTPGSGSGYTIDVELESGRRLRVEDMGYVSTGLAADDKFEITSGEIRELSVADSRSNNP